MLLYHKTFNNTLSTICRQKYIFHGVHTSKYHTFQGIQSTGSHKNMDIYGNRGEFSVAGTDENAGGTRVNGRVTWITLVAAAVAGGCGADNLVDDTTHVNTDFRTGGGAVVRNHHRLRFPTSVSD